jgi:hypothetical protein
MKDSWKDIKYRDKIINSQKKRWENIESRERMSEIKKELYNTKEYQKILSDAQKKRFSTRDSREKHSVLLKEFYKDPKHYIQLIENTIGGLWYGNVRYNDKKQYCEKWCRDLWDRIDLFWDYKSILSGKTKKDNNGYKLSRHHVYWQEKACCEWDEDIQGYYIIINIGTNKTPNWYKYYIKGDPNKFVLLTRSEHRIIAKDKLKWIKYFENIIENDYNGKCYYTKEEYDKLNI